MSGGRRRGSRRAETATDGGVISGEGGDMEVKIVSLPKGEDPDSYVNKYGKDEFED